MSSGARSWSGPAAVGNIQLTAMAAQSAQLVTRTTAHRPCRYAGADTVVSISFPWCHLVSAGRFMSCRNVVIGWSDQ